MIKQFYRFLSIVIVSNLLLIPAAFSKAQKNVKNPVKSTNTCLEELEKLAKQKASKPQKSVKENNQKPYVTKYGVFFPDDIDYPQPQPPNNNKPEPVKPLCDDKPVVKPQPVVQPPNDDIYVTKYGVYFPDDIYYQNQQPQDNNQKTDKQN